MKDASEDVQALARGRANSATRSGSCCARTIPAFVFFLEIRGRGVFLRATPIDVSSIVREHLLDRPRATVLTSATLAVERVVRVRAGDGSASDDGRGTAPAVGVRLSQRRRCCTCRRAHARPAFAGVRRARRARDRRDPVGAREGRAFVLFTSYANLREVHARIARLGCRIRCWCRATRRARVLIEQFRTTANAVLLATSSFWQGVDVVGEALSCVIIDKLPFASPGDPVVQARIEAITESGGDAFQSYQVPLAILTLLQGLGRLLRHRNDRGVLAVLDPRLRTMGYGRRFLESLPPAPITHRIDDVERFFAE